MDFPSSSEIHAEHLAKWPKVEAYRRASTPEVDVADLLNTESFVVYDTEHTSWPGSVTRRWSRVGEFRELIQVGAARVRAGGVGVEVVDTFNVLVKPVANPKLSGHVSAVTGISQARVDADGLDARTALDAFFEFLGDQAGIAFGDDHVVLKETATINDYPLPADAGRFRSIRASLPAALGLDRSLASGQIGSAIGRPPETGAPHDAIYDVLSIVAGLRLLAEQSASAR